MKSVLVTGAARGIGRATCLRLAAENWQVFAGVRSVADGAALVAADARITPVTLDVTDPRQIAELARTLPAELTAVVNNAGVVVDGPVECLTAEALRDLFSVNLFGAVAITQAVLPRIRRAHGRILFISSASGRVSTPWSGAYNSSKFALEGIVDALRMELRPWGIRTVLIEPGPTATDIWADMTSMLERTAAGLDPHQRALYDGHIEGMRRILPRMQRHTVPADKVVDAVARALTARRPRRRYVVGLPAKAQLLAARFTPTAVLDVITALTAGVPRKAPTIGRVSPAR